MNRNKKSGISLMVVIIILVIIILIVSGVVLVVKNSNKGTKNQENSNTKVETKNSKKIYDSTDAYTYVEVNGGIAITDFQNLDFVEYDKVIIPDKIDGKTVVGIGDLNKSFLVFQALYGSKCEVVIPDTVKYIGESAFQSAYGLIKVSGGKNCKSIGKYAFMNCESLSEITFIDNVTDVADNAFAGCTTWKANH